LWAVAEGLARERQLAQKRCKTADNKRS
jgi:hypothetical protein